MKYDDASWHYGGQFPKDLPKEAGATHTGMFLVWALLSGLSGSMHLTDFPDDIPRLRSREITPGAFFFEACDGKFTDDDLNDEGNAFTKIYYDSEAGKFNSDYEKSLCKNISGVYYVKDTWENFDILKPVLDRRFNEWKKPVTQHADQTQPTKKSRWLRLFGR